MQTRPLAALRLFLASILGAIGLPRSFNFAGNTTIGTPGITFGSWPTVPITIGAPLSGVEVPPGTTVLAADKGALTLTMSQNALGTAAATPLVIGNASAAGAPELHLYTATDGPGPNPTPADFTEATFDTYAPLSIPSSTPVFTDPNGNAVTVIDVNYALAADPVTPNTILGYWIDVDISGTRQVIAWESFPSPKPMTANGDAVVGTVPLSLPAALSAVLDS